MKVIGISGKMGSGKTSSRELLVRELEAKGKNVAYMKTARYLYGALEVIKKECKFQDPAKDARQAFESIKKYFISEGFKYEDKIDQYDFELIDYLRGYFSKRLESGDPVEKLNTQDGEILQYLGTEYAQRKWGKKVWVEKLCNNIIELSNLEHSVPDYVILDDIRFRHEVSTLLEVLDSYGIEVVFVRLEASEEVRKLRCEKWRNNTNHPSEIDLDDFEGFDLVIDTEVTGLSATVIIILTNFCEV